ncbi:MAG: hypothetical protein ACJA2G_002208, partial [Cognaticolwellia sp.]
MIQVDLKFGQLIKTSIRYLLKSQHFYLSCRPPSFLPVNYFIFYRKEIMRQNEERLNPFREFL